MLKVENRLSNKQKIQEIMAKGKPFFSQFFGLKHASNREKHSRFVMVISLKISKKAVIRNKLRRQMKAVVVDLLPKVKPGFDIIILTKPVSVNLQFNEIKKEIEYLFKKSGLFI